jgi:hypothetical protein
MLVSAIMPTRARRVLSYTAVECWKAQTWEDRELVILDDADDPSFPVPPGDPGIRYYRGPREFIGVKLEKLSALAQGEVIIRFDSDDWSDPNRIQEQVDHLALTGKGLTGYHTLLFWDMRARRFAGYQWRGPSGFACGTSMCYTRQFWQSHPWPPLREASDNAVVYAAQKDNAIATLEGRQMCIARAHGNNTSSAQRIGQNNWPQVPDSEFPEAFFEAIRLEALQHAA